MVLIRALSQAICIALSIATVLVVWRTAHAPGQADLLRRVTQENGIVEWGSVAILGLILLTSLYALWIDRKSSGLPPGGRAVLIGLAGAALLAALEEISWGQQVFGFRSSQFFLENNLQRETNLHNLLPASVSSSIINTTVYILFLWLPCLVGIAPASRLTAIIRKTHLERFRPSFSTMMIFAFGSTLQAYFLFPTWSDTAALLLTLVLIGWMLRQAGSPWQQWVCLGLVGLCAGFFAAHHHVFRFANMQYEIRELVVVLGCLHWITDWADPGRKLNR